MTHDRQPIWYRLLKYWQFEQEGKKGSSLSYSLLIGAYDAFGIGFGDAASVEAFSIKLINEMTAGAIEGRFPVEVPCPFIGRRAVSLVDHAESDQDTQLAHGPLWKLYSDGVRSRRYSVAMQKFDHFNRIDLGWMQSALGLKPTDEYLAFAGIAGERP